MTGFETFISKCFRSSWRELSEIRNIFFLSRLLKEKKKKSQIHILERDAILRYCFVVGFPNESHIAGGGGL